MWSSHVHPILSSHAIVLCYHPALSSLGIIPCYCPMLSSHVTVLSYIIVSCYHHVLSSHVIIWSYPHMLSFKMITDSIIIPKNLSHSLCIYPFYIILFTWPTLTKIFTLKPFKNKLGSCSVQCEIPATTLEWNYTATRTFLQF
jgi:hypothetical protein